MKYTTSNTKIIDITFSDTETNWKKLLGTMRTWSPGTRQDLVWLYTAVEEAVEGPEDRAVEGPDIPPYHLHDASGFGENLDCARCHAGYTDGPVYHLKYPE